MHSARSALIAFLCAVLAMGVGIWLGGHPQDLPKPIRDALVDDDRALRAELLDQVQDNFYKPVDKAKLEDASLKGIVSSLNDPYSHYFSPDEAGAVQDSVSGAFSGVGMTVEQDPRGLKVLGVFDGSPAKDAGIARGDVITAVNDRSIAGVDSDLATARIKGEPGTSVKLTVTKPGSRRARTLTLTRKRVQVPLVSGRLVERDGTKIGVVRLASFSAGAHGELRAKVDKLLKQGAQGIVLDLRGNPGGLLTEGVLVSSIFIEDGKIVSVRGRSRPEQTQTAQGDAIDAKIPVVVLVDGGSASASEIVTGALRDRHRATVVGTHTFGKGLVQEVKQLSNGGLLDLTVANYYLPGGETILPKRGIKPQVRAKDDPKTARDEALPVAIDTLLKQRQ
ncbi:MAG TPA: S41 family peptidase [Thermoleophilaceae bacterium]